MPQIFAFNFLACLLAFVPCFLLFVFRFSFLSFLIFFLHPGMFIFFVSLPLCSSHLLLSASTGTYFIVRVLSACCVICTLPHLAIILLFIRFFFFVALISRVAFFLLCSRTRYANTWMPTLNLQRLVFLCSHCLWPQIWYLSRMKNQEGHWGYCWWCRWVERTVYVKTTISGTTKIDNVLPGYTGMIYRDIYARHKEALVAVATYNVRTLAAGIILFFIRLVFFS